MTPPKLPGPPALLVALISLVAPVACTSASDSTRSPDPSPAPPATTAEPSAARPAPAPAPSPTPAAGDPGDPSLTAWRWVTRKDDTEFPHARDARGRGGAIYRLVIEREPDRASVQRLDEGGAVIWSRALESRFFDGGYLLAHAGQVLVAHFSHIASGCRVYALDEATGDVTWKSDLQALGPVSHSKYRNRVQMQVLAGRLVVYGFEAQGRYVEIVDLATGDTLRNVRPDPRLAAVEWQWDKPERTSFRAGPTTITTPAGATYTYTPANQPAPATIVKRARAGGRASWTHEFEAEGTCGDAAMLERDGVLYAAHYCSVATGARLLAVDADTGAARWGVPLDGLGGVAHSEYWNDVEIRTVHDHLALFGSEAAGRYIEVRRPDTGALVSVQTFWNR